MVSQTMRLKAVYFDGPSETGLPYHKAMVYEKDVPYFLEMGASLDQPEISVSKIEEGEYQFEQDEDGADDPVVHGDKGDGAPGSLRWHFNHVKSMEKSDDIVKYTYEVIKEKPKVFHSLMTLKDVKLAALRAIKEHLRDDNES